MGDEPTILWTGAGRWLMIGLGILLITLAIPLVFSRDNGAAAGWNIFLGLLAIGAVASGNRKVPLLALVLALLMMVRLGASIVFGASGWSICFSLVIAAIAGIAAYDLRRQATSD